MLRSLLQDTRLLLLLLAVLLLKLFSLQPSWVERWYARGIYPGISWTQDLFLGWLPISLGDLLYAAAVIYLLYAAWRLAVLVRKGQLKGKIRTILYRVMKTALWIYIIFNVLWGLNYNRQGIARQLGFDSLRYSAAEVKLLTAALQQRLNGAAARVDAAARKPLNNSRWLSREGASAFDRAAGALPFLDLMGGTIKPSLFSPIGHFIGYTGYFNPFTGEAQVNTSIPAFLKPFVACHEMAHQMGYGRENEANFVGFLAARSSDNPHLSYAAYFDMYRYALRDLYRIDTTAATSFRSTLHPLVLRDNEALRAFFLKTKNPIEPLASAFYDRYLKLNSQASGLRTYNEVVALLIAYQKKFGKESL